MERQFSIVLGDGGDVFPAAEVDMAVSAAPLPVVSEESMRLATLRVVREAETPASMPAYRVVGDAVAVAPSTGRENSELRAKTSQLFYPVRTACRETVGGELREWTDVPGTFEMPTDRCMASKKYRLATQQAQE